MDRIISLLRLAAVELEDADRYEGNRDHRASCIRKAKSAIDEATLRLHKKDV